MWLFVLCTSFFDICLSVRGGETVGSVVSSRTIIIVLLDILSRSNLTGYAALRVRILMLWLDCFL